MTKTPLPRPTHIPQSQGSSAPNSERPLNPTDLLLGSGLMVTILGTATYKLVRDRLQAASSNQASTRSEAEIAQERVLDQRLNELTYYTLVATLIQRRFAGIALPSLVSQIAARVNNPDANLPFQFSDDYMPIGDPLVGRLRGQQRLTRNQVIELLDQAGLITHGTQANTHLIRPWLVEFTSELQKQNPTPNPTLQRFIQKLQIVSESLSQESDFTFSERLWRRLSGNSRS